MKKHKGKFITFEGSEGSGKSTQIRMISHYLKDKKRKFIFVREPGGVKISEKIRRILLDDKNKSMANETEMLLYMASRAQLVSEVIEPELKKGSIVLCDRFLDSTVAYQGYGLGMDHKLIKKIGDYATKNISPDITFLFNIKAAEGLKRINRTKDRIEQRKMAYHNKVHKGYLAIARSEPKRVKVIDSTLSKEEIHHIVRQYVDKII